MTLSEFRAWLDGFTEAMDGAPTAEQWAKIKAKLATISPFGSVGTPGTPGGIPQWPIANPYIGTTGGIPPHLDPRFLPIGGVAVQRERAGLTACRGASLSIGNDGGTQIFTIDDGD